MYAIALAALISATPAVAFADGHHSEHHTVTTTPTLAVEPPEQMIEQARLAQASGDLATAYEGFTRATRLQRTAGLLAIDASYGAAHVLTMQARYREAADVLEQLAADANLLGDAETEARVLLDVVSLKVNHRRRAAARPDAMRLKELITDVRLTSDTRRLIKARLS